MRTGYNSPDSARNAINAVLEKCGMTLDNIHFARPEATESDVGDTLRVLDCLELLEALPDLTGEARVDMGNLYRVLRALEEDGLVTSRWESGEPGPAKRIYELTLEGRRLLDEWATALRRSRERIDTFLDRHEGR